VAVERKDPEVEEERPVQEMVVSHHRVGWMMMKIGILSSKLNIIVTISNMVGLQLVRFISR